MMTVPMLLPVLAVTPMMMLLSVLVLVPVPFVIMLLIVIMPMVISVVLAVVVVPVVAVAVTAAVTVTMAESGGMRQNPAQGCVPDNAGLLVGGDELDFRASARGWLLPRG